MKSGNGGEESARQSQLPAPSTDPTNCDQSRLVHQKTYADGSSSDVATSTNVTTIDHLASIVQRIKRDILLLRHAAPTECDRQLVHPLDVTVQSALQAATDVIGGGGSGDGAPPTPRCPAAPAWSADPENLIRNLNRLLVALRAGTAMHRHRHADRQLQSVAVKLERSAAHLADQVAKYEATLPPASSGTFTRLTPTQASYSSTMHKRFSTLQRREPVNAHKNRFLPISRRHSSEVECIDPLDASPTLAPNAATTLPTLTKSLDSFRETQPKTGHVKIIVDTVFEAKHVSTTTSSSQSAGNHLGVRSLSKSHSFRKDNHKLPHPLQRSKTFYTPRAGVTSTSKRASIEELQHFKLQTELRMKLRARKGISTSVACEATPAVERSLNESVTDSNVHIATQINRWENILNCMATVEAGPEPAAEPRVADLRSPEDTTGHAHTEDSTKMVTSKPTKNNSFMKFMKKSLRIPSDNSDIRRPTGTDEPIAATFCDELKEKITERRQHVEAKELQGGGVADTPYLSKSLNSSPVVLRKADEVTLPLPEITRAKSFVHMKTSTSFISDGPHVSDNSLTILWEALIDKSKIIDDQKKNKKWLSNTYGCLTKKTFYLFANKKTFEQLKAGSKDKGTFDIKIDLSSCEIKSKSEHSSRKNLLVLVDKQTGAEILLQDKNNQVWLAAITRVLKVDVAGQMVAAPRPKTMHINEPAALASTKEQKRIRDVLRQFFGRRPPVEQLIKSGIYKDDLVFGGDLERICHAMERPKIPPFVVVCVEAIELHMDADGLYRASGNVSQIQNLRFEVNQSNFDGLMDDKNDIHVLAGVLKLFFRELRTPVIPGSEYEHCLQAIKHRSSIDMIHELRMCLARLPTAHQDTLKYLIQHLIKVADNKENRMDVANVAMIWGPNLMQTSQIHTDLSDMYFLCSQQMKIIKTFINYYVRIFDDP